jgi:MOSC domain-containing protein YiiM
MEEVCEGLSASLNPRWRGGICCRVIQGGEIQVGDAVQLLE